jgi:hypothetical protein
MARRAFERNVYWRLPNLLVLALGVAAVAGGLALIAVGNVLLGSVVLGLAVLGLLVLAQEAARHERVARKYARMRALSGYARASVRAWSRTGGRVARLRLESSRLLRERNRAQFALGAAAYACDESACEDLIAQMRTLDEQLAACAAETARAITRAQERVAEERLAISPTEIHRVS